MKNYLFALAAAALASVSLAGCASSVYTPYEGRGYFSGGGGAKRTAHGIDWWIRGEPPRRYRIIGIIEDTKGYAMITGSLDSDAIGSKRIARLVLERGGHAVIVRENSEVRRGSVGSASFWRWGAIGTSTDLYDKQTLFEVIRYGR